MNIAFIDIQISLTPIVGAEQYELEWVYVDDYLVDYTVVAGVPTRTVNYSPITALPGVVNFKDNATRVLLSGGTMNYFIPNTYEHGYLFFRVRPINATSLTDKTPVYGAWSAADATLTTAVETVFGALLPTRSEERRVGKEC